MARWVVRHYSPAHLFLPLVCVQLKDDAVALADVLAPPDPILQSAIGRENGEVRQHRWPVKWLCGVHMVYCLCVFVCLRFTLVCVVFVTCMGPHMRTLLGGL